MYEASTYEKIIKTVFSDFQTKLFLDNKLLEFDVIHNDKYCTVNWPLDIGEVFIDYYENDVKVFSDWFDFYEGENDEEIVKIILSFIKLFLENQYRVITEGRIFKSKNLEIKQNDKWCPIGEIAW